LISISQNNETNAGDEIVSIEDLNKEKKSSSQTGGYSTS